MLSPAAAIKMTMAGFSFYGGLGFAAPALCYKLLFRGGIWPGTKKSETLTDDGDVVHEQAIKWMGFVVLYDIVNSFRLTEGFKVKQKELLENQAGLWILAAAMHAPAYKSGGHPKGICIQNMLYMPVIALVSFLASKKA